MTTLIVQLPPSLVIRFAGAADRAGLSHQQLATLALRMFLHAEEHEEKSTRPGASSRRRPRSSAR